MDDTIHKAFLPTNRWSLIRTAQRLGVSYSSLSVRAVEIGARKEVVVSKWSDKHIDLLKSEWKKGSPASVIAEVISKLEEGVFFTRNAVIGKSYRLNLSERPPRNSGRPKQEKAPRVRPPKPEKSMIINKKASSPKFYPAAVPLTTKPPISIMGLNADTCHAIVGHGANGLAVYCGDFTFAGKPFCEGHCAMYYQAPEARSHRRRY